jgi:hypothetical protein
MNFNWEEPFGIVPSNIEFQSAIVYLINGRFPFKPSCRDLIIAVNFFDIRNGTGPIISIVITRDYCCMGIIMTTSSRAEPFESISYSRLTSVDPSPTGVGQLETTN